MRMGLKTQSGVTLPDTSPAFAGGTDTVILLAHVRRWKSDKRFFKALGKVFSISDITSTIDKDAHLLTSNTKGALRLFELRRHRTQ